MGRPRIDDLRERTGWTEQTVEHYVTGGHTSTRRYIGELAMQHEETGTVVRYLEKPKRRSGSYYKVFVDDDCIFSDSSLSAKQDALKLVANRMEEIELRGAA